METVTHTLACAQGLPVAWRQVLQGSGISRKDIDNHPQEVLDVLQFHFEGKTLTLQN